MLSSRKQCFSMPRRTSSTLRRHLKADRLLSSGLIVMRACSFCRTHNFLCVVAPESPHCERCFRSHLECELAPPDAKAERLLKEEERLASEIAAAYAKTSRLRKQHRAVMKKLRDLGSREDRNILELEMDEMLSDGQLPAPGALNSPSPRPSSFTVPVGEGSTDPFLGLLDSPGRSAEVPQGSS
jgi:hypothetical protein